MRDFVVVGAGPAGSRFARRAAEAGHDVLLLERGEVGQPLACSGHVSRDVWSFTPEGAREELLQNEISGARFHVGGPEGDGYPFYREEPVSHVIDRVGLDRCLADAAREAGAELRCEHTVTAVETDDAGVTVTASTPDGETTVRGRLVVGCDGPTSRVRRESGLPEPTDLLHGVLGFVERPDSGDFVDVHIDVPGFFSWRIPRGDAGVEYGLAGAPDADVSGRFEALLAAYDVAVTNRCSGAIPIGPPAQVSGDRTVLIGDAAGQTKPFTGGGILYGMTAADHAVATIDPRDPDTLAAYERAWRDDLGWDIRLGRLLRWGYDWPRPLQRLGLRLFSGRIGVHMDRPTSLFSGRQLRAMFSR